MDLNLPFEQAICAKHPGVRDQVSLPIANLSNVRFRPLEKERAL